MDLNEFYDGLNLPYEYYSRFLLVFYSNLKYFDKK